MAQMQEHLLGGEASERERLARRVRRRHSTLGWISLVGLVVTWVAQSEVAQYLEVNLHYRKPCLITWVNHSFSIFLLPILWAVHAATTGNCSGWTSSLAADGLTSRVALLVAAQLGTIYLVGDLLWYVGLAFTSVAAGTAVFNSSCALTFLLSAFVLRTRVSLKSVVAIVITLAGVAVVAIAPSSPDAASRNTAAMMPPSPAANEAPPGSSPLLGNLLVFSAAACYSVYEVWLGAVLRRTGVAGNSVALVNGISGCLGLFNIVACWPAVLAVSYVPAEVSWLHEPFVWPDAAQLGYLLLDALLAMLFNVSISMAVAFTSPTLTATCTVLTIPCSALTDWMLWGRRPPLLTGLGGLLIMGGFTALATEERRLASIASRSAGARATKPLHVSAAVGSFDAAMQRGGEGEGDSGGGDEGGGGGEGEGGGGACGGEMADDRLLSRSDRFEFRTPSAARDREMFALFNDADVMLPWLPQLCPMGWEAMKARRELHRAGIRSGESCCMDIVVAATATADERGVESAADGGRSTATRESSPVGTLVGTSGFRQVSNGVAEWGVVISKPWQRKGVCAEAWQSNVAFARDVLGCHTVTAATLESNGPMRNFLEERQGLRCAEVVAAHGLDWWKYMRPLGVGSSGIFSSSEGPSN